jgi:hypothetical protein
MTLDDACARAPAALSLSLSLSHIFSLPKRTSGQGQRRTSGSRRRSTWMGVARLRARSQKCMDASTSSLRICKLAMMRSDAMPLNSHAARNGTHREQLGVAEHALLQAAIQHVAVGLEHLVHGGGLGGPGDAVSALARANSNAWQGARTSLRRASNSCQCGSSTSTMV